MGTAVVDKASRSLAKAVSWRLLAALILGGITFAVTGSWEASTLITLVYNLVQVFVYYGHERLWERIPWGRRPSLDHLPPAHSLDGAQVTVIQERLRDLGYIE